MLATTVRKVRNFVNKSAARRWLDANSPADMVELGSDYGSWSVPRQALRPGKIAICAGAGEDVTFDVLLNAEHGMKVFTVDPTPRARDHVLALIKAHENAESYPITNAPDENYRLENWDLARFDFRAVGLWGENSRQRFFAPQKSTSVSHSIVNLQRTQNFFEAECLTLKTFCERESISEIEILKIDIEGAEYYVIDRMIADGILPTVVCVEYDEGWNPMDSDFLDRIYQSVEAMKSAGYRLIHINRWDFVFAR